MPQTVTDQNGVVHVFPDEATPEMIAKAMGVSLPNTTTPPPSQGDGLFSGLTKLVGPTLSNFNPLPILGLAAREVPHIAAGMVGYPMSSPDPATEAIKGMFAPLKQWEQIPADLRAGNYTNAANHFAGGIPIVGPQAEAASHAFQAGDPLTGLGDMAGMVTQFVGGPETAAAIGGKATNLARSIAENTGVNLAKRALKIPKNIAEQAPAFEDGSPTGNLRAAETQIARTALDHNVLPSSADNLEKMAQNVNTLGELTSSLPAQSKVRGSRKLLTSAILDNVNGITSFDAPQLNSYYDLKFTPDLTTRTPFKPADLNTATKLYEQELDNPGNYSASELDRTKKDIYNETSYKKRSLGAADKTPFEGNVRTAQASNINDFLRSKIPGYEEVNQDYSEMKPTLAAMTAMQTRAGHLNPFTLTDMIGGEAGRQIADMVGGAGIPGALTGIALSQLRRPAALSRVAQGLYNVGTSSDINNLARAILANPDVMRGVSLYNNSY